ncbi:hypothetical protein KC318_g13488 [Hortaea werneckii]|uniref:Transcriptional coactivator p15 (PC4) C-terminal domain-containing protein n=1 Tax=Hortaea werneckii TaxID=91943 RepID=A0A3M7CQX5_HORWE|nr:hypothetical protein KC334_g13758 [Hortaea werneckii]KAI6971456.1 hypothetical protein KC355_g11750 [Hortaea werneckii]KAI7180330.1 hypothetical protein KC324_g9141 [Hortaea werneckii]KAI7540664.1 hypothetical protein KC331_g9042 [Hortaea werneckii]KAI7654590.1 hypothetical protein KC318_g13488 [Hortaea werneckii]
MPKRSSEYVNEDGDDFVEDAPQNKKRRGGAKAQAHTEIHKDDDGNEFWEISGKRRVQVSTFKGSTFVGIREFYEKDGKMLPGKKGISLSVDQYNAVVEVMPQIEQVLKNKNVEVARPDYDKGEESGAPVQEESEPNAASDDAKSDKKANHEATSDEDEG